MLAEEVAMSPVPADAFWLATQLPSGNVLGAKGADPASGDLCDIYPGADPPAPNQSWTWAYDGVALEVAAGNGLLLSVSLSRPRFDQGRGGYQIEVAAPPADGWPEPWQLWDWIEVGEPGSYSRVIASHWMPDGQRWVLGVRHALDQPGQPVDIYPAPAGPGSWEQRDYPPQQRWNVALPFD